MYKQSVLFYPHRFQNLLLSENHHFSDLDRFKQITFERIMRLDIWADDYVVKPFSPSEVMARLRAVLRRITPGESKAGSSLAISSLYISLDKYKVTVNGQEVHLTKKKPRSCDFCRPMKGSYSQGTAYWIPCGDVTIMGMTGLWTPISRGCVQFTL